MKLSARFPVKFPVKFRMPKLMVLAFALLVIHGISWALGLEDWVGLLSGTPVPGVSLEFAAMGASLHVLSWFGAVVVAPILIIASVLLEAASAVGADAESESRGSGEASQQTA